MGQPETKEQTKNKAMSDFFNQTLREVDPIVAEIIDDELIRQSNQVEMIASENITSPAVIEAEGSVMTNKYAEGYSGKRYYEGCENMDRVETLCAERACEMFGAKHAIVQPHSGSQANQAVYLKVLKPGDTVLGMDLSAGGHLTHGSEPNASGQIYNGVYYGVDRNTFLIDYDEVERLAQEHKPKMIICGASAYPRHIDFKRFREIADSVDAFLLADIAHYSGLIVAGKYPNPIEHAHAVTSTTHKTLRGPRGGIILTNDSDLFKKLKSGIFPGIQGGPLMQIISAKAVAFGQALSQEFKDYQEQVIKNARVLSDNLIRRGFDVLTGGTDCHMILVDLRNRELTGKDFARELDRIGITANKNGVPFDETSPFITSGIRLGSPAATTRGMGSAEFTELADIIADTAEKLIESQKSGLDSLPEPAAYELRQRVQELCARFPIYKQSYAQFQPSTKQGS